jgi:hypothetical protein
LSPIHINKGGVIVSALGLFSAFVISNISTGNYGTLLVVQLMCYSCVFFEFSRDNKPRINAIFPLIFVLAPVGCYMSYSQKGLFNLAMFTVSILLVFFWGKKFGRRQHPLETALDQE